MQVFRLDQGIHPSLPFPLHPTIESTSNLGKEIHFTVRTVSEVRGLVTTK